MNRCGNEICIGAGGNRTCNACIHKIEMQIFLILGFYWGRGAMAWPCPPIPTPMKCAL